MEAGTNWDKRLTFELCPNETEVLKKVWDEIHDLVWQAQEQWELLYTYQSLKDMTVSGLVYPWIVRDKETNKIKLVILTQITEYPQGKVGEVVLASGSELLQNMHLVQVMEGCAVRFGVKIFLVKGRLGFRKAMAKEGYNLMNVNYVKVYE